MNLILFEPHEIDVPLLRSDRRATHIIEVLRRQVGDEFDVGLLNGPRGRAMLTAIDETKLSLAYRWSSSVAPPDALTVLVGLPRPQTARDLLREMTTLGVTKLHFITTEKTEPNYASSTLWSSGEWKRHLVAGAEQAFDTRVPEVSWGRSLNDTIAGLPPANARIALDNYEGASALGHFQLSSDLPVTLAVGPERGWSAQERFALKANQFTLVHLGSRVLRVETAAIAAVSILRGKRGQM